MENKLIYMYNVRRQYYGDNRFQILVVALSIADPGSPMMLASIFVVFGGGFNNLIARASVVVKLCLCIMILLRINFKTHHAQLIKRASTQIKNTNSDGSQKCHDIIAKFNFEVS